MYNKERMNEMLKTLDEIRGKAPSEESIGIGNEIINNQGGITMQDIRKMLEKQLEILQDASMNTEVAAECSYAMIEIIDVLYPDGIHKEKECGEIENITGKFMLSAEEIAAIREAPRPEDLAVETTPMVFGVSGLSTTVELDSEEIASTIIDHLEKKSKLVGKAGSLEIRIAE